MWQADFAQALNDDFESLKKKNPRFSVRAYARRIGLSAGSVSDLMRRKSQWQLSAGRAAQIVEKMGLRRSVRNMLLIRMGAQPVLEKASLDGSSYDLLTKWFYYPILFSFSLPPFLRSIPLIAKRLRLDEGVVAQTVDELIARNLLTRDSEGQVSRQDDFLSTSDGVSSESIRKHHLDGLELAKRSLESHSVERRDFTSYTFVGSEKKLDNLRQEIRSLIEKSSALVDDGDANDQVFRLSVQLFPMDF